MILSPIEQRIKEKIEKVGTPLKDWDIQINYGIKTGYNEAFIVSGEKKQEILDNCKDENERKRTDELIRPILRGKDIKRYGYNFADKWLICISAGYTNAHRQGIEPEEFIKQKYPSVYAHFMRVHEEYISNPTMRRKSKGLKGRDDMGDYWWELRSCAYLEDFSKQKIVWGEISDKTKFALDYEGHYYNEATTFYLVGENLKYLLCALNAKISEWQFSRIGTTTGVGTVRWKKYTIGQLLLPHISDNEAKKFSTIVDQMQSEGSSLEKEDEINRLIFGVYGLTQEEINFIESI